VKQLRGQSVIQQPQLTLSTDNVDDDAATDELEEVITGKY